MSVHADLAAGPGPQALTSERRRGDGNLGDPVLFPVLRGEFGGFQVSAQPLDRGLVEHLVRPPGEGDILLALGGLVVRQLIFGVRAL